jgi:hypothetical protein
LNHFKRDFEKTLTTLLDNMETIKTLGGPFVHKTYVRQLLKFNLQKEGPLPAFNISIVFIGKSGCCVTFKIGLSEAITHEDEHDIVINYVVKDSKDGINDT